ncbi:paraplegin-like [Lineus longissimus]|uniref:paraplegin-like n=1 Tax=Lineus longissimus TaxID=88925 RepID=UPI002B4C3530
MERFVSKFNTSLMASHCLQRIRADYLRKNASFRAYATSNFGRNSKLLKTTKSIKSVLPSQTSSIKINPLLGQYIPGSHNQVNNGYRHLLNYSQSRPRLRLFTTTSTACSRCLQQRFVQNPHVSYLHLRREGKALWRILERSNLTHPDDLSRLFGIGSYHWFSTSRRHHQQQDDPNKDEKGNEKKGPDKMPFLPRLFFLSWLAFAVVTTMRLISGEDTTNYRFVSWNEFVHDMLAKGEVEEVTIRPEAEVAIIHLADGAVVKGRRADSGRYTMKIPDPAKFEAKLRKVEEELGVSPGRGVPVTYQRESNWGPFIILAAVSVVIFFVLRSFMKVSLPNPMDMFASERKAKFMRVDLLTQQGKGVSFKDVAGLKEAKVEIMEFVDYIRHPKKFREIGAKVPRGALLTGPPGCGKTLLAKAVATEAKVPFLAMAGSEFVEMIGGLGAARVRDLFKEARNRAPCIIYIDEIDAIGRKRGAASYQGSSEEEHTLNQLLVEMDGMGTVEGVIMLGSTNRADVLDKAILRPGRFDRHINIDLPTLEERNEIFNMYLKKLKLTGISEQYASKMAELSPGMSGADIANICNEAALHAARDKKKSIDRKDFEYAVERVVAGAAKKSRVLSPSEKKMVAYHEAGHVIVGWMLKHTDALLRVSIVPRTSNALGFAQYMPSDNKLISSDELFEKMCMALGGRVAESVVFNKISTGAQDDLQKVTKWAYDQIRLYGMNSTIGPLSYPLSDNSDHSIKPYSKKMAHTIDEEARSLVARAYANTERVINEYKDQLQLLAQKLLEKEVLSFEEVEALIGSPPHGPKRVISFPGWEGEENSRDHNKTNVQI